MVEDKKCSFSSKLQEWLDNPDDAVLAKEVQSHLLHCQLCSRESGLLQLVRQRLKQQFAKELVPPSNESVNKVMAAVVSCTKPDLAKGTTETHRFFDRSIAAWFPRFGLAFALLVFIVLFRFYAFAPPSSTVKSSPGLADNFYSLIISKHNGPFKADLPEQMPVEGQPLALNKPYALSPAAVILVTSPGMKFTFSRSAEFLLDDDRVVLNNGSIDANLSEYEPGFYLKIPDAKIYPTGTRFKIDIKTGHTQIELHSGKLKIKSLSGQTVEMSEPGKLFVLAGGTIDTRLPAIAPTPIPNNLLMPAPDDAAHPRNNQSNNDNASEALPKTLLDSF